MSHSFDAVRITDRLFWVGAIDWDVRDFHGYSTPSGSTYNAYLLRGPEGWVLFDTVKEPFTDEMLSRVSSVVEPSGVDFLVSNHSEPDHTGALGATLQALGPVDLVASAMGAKNLEEHYHGLPDIQVADDGGKLSLAGVDILFLETRMLHWPDSMFSYLPDTGTLISQDAFGMHLAGSGRFADQYDMADLRWQAAKYYANILMPYSPLVGRLLEKVGDLGLEIRTLAPDHGPVYARGGDPGPDWIVGLWNRWASGERERRVVIAYDTMWGSTELMARSVAEGVCRKGAAARVLQLGRTHRSDVATEVLEAGGLVVGSPTINNRFFPTLGDVMTYLQGLGPRGLVGACFGSYGWSGEAVGQLEEILDDMKVERVAESVSARFVPDDGKLAECVSLGAAVAESM
jgi:flavorubredoxin